MTHLTLNEDGKFISIAIETVLYQSEKQQLIRIISDSENETKQYMIDRILKLASEFKATTEDLMKAE